MSTIKVDGIRSNSASSDAITLASDGTCTANITNRTNKNLILNGAFQIAQRGLSSTSSGYHTVDRWNIQNGNTGVTVTQSQQATSSSDEPYQNGFQNFARIALSGAGTTNTNAYMEFQQRMEAQNIANSGWNFKSSSSNITVSFWFRASTNQTFYGYLTTSDGTAQRYTFSFTASGNNAWTKITKTISGNSNLDFNNDNGEGLHLVLTPFYGTDFTNNKTLDAWAASDNTNFMPDMASTWLTAGASTFDITGVQLEVGSVATDFEHRSFAQELYLCQRYFEFLKFNYYFVTGYYEGNGNPRIPLHWNVEKRTTPTVTLPSVGTGSGEIQVTNSGGAYDTSSTTLAANHITQIFCKIHGSGYGGSSGTVCSLYLASANSGIKISAEL